MCQCDEPGARREQALELVEHKLAGGVERCDPQQRAAAFAGELPRHDVRVVFHLADEDFVARAEALTVARSDEIDRLGGAAHEDDFLAPRGMDELPHLVARGFVGLGCALAQKMHAAVNIGVERGVVMRLAVDHAVRLLTGGRVVEIDQRLAMHMLVQDGEILAQPLHIEGGPGAIGRRLINSLPARFIAASSSLPAGGHAAGLRAACARV